MSATILSKQRSKTTDPTRYTVNVAWDDEAKVWIAMSDEIPLALESEHYDILLERVHMAVPELLELNYNTTSPVSLTFRTVELSDIG